MLKSNQGQLTRCGGAISAEYTIAASQGMIVSNAEWHGVSHKISIVGGRASVQHTVHVIEHIL